jgi:GMP synthase (glutamine-hydrolysing)
MQKKRRRMKNICIIKTGSTFEAIQNNFQDFEHWILWQLDLMHVKVFTVNVEFGEALPDVASCGGVILTGSHSMVTEQEEWSRKTEAWLVEIVKRDIPLLAICYGHQLLAKALGGIVEHHSKGMEIGTVVINLSENAQEDKLFCTLPSRFKAHTIHSQSVIALPHGAIRLASNTHDKNHAFRVGKNAWGVQFHPEFTKTIMDSYIEEVAKEGMLEEEKTRALHLQSDETIEANSLLKRFETLVCQNE